MGHPNAIFTKSGHVLGNKLWSKKQKKVISTCYAKYLSLLLKCMLKFWFFQRTPPLSSKLNVISMVRLKHVEGT